MLRFSSTSSWLESPPEAVQKLPRAKHTLRSSRPCFCPHRPLMPTSQRSEIPSVTATAIRQSETRKRIPHRHHRHLRPVTIRHLICGVLLELRHRRLRLLLLHNKIFGSKTGRPRLRKVSRAAPPGAPLQFILRSCAPRSPHAGSSSARRSSRLARCGISLPHNRAFGLARD